MPCTRPIVSNSPSGSVHPSHTEAEIWFQLHAWTWMVFLLAPRVVMLVYTGVRCSRLAADLPLDLEESYYRRVLAP